MGLRTAIPRSKNIVTRLSQDPEDIVDAAVGLEVVR